MKLRTVLEKSCQKKKRKFKSKYHNKNTQWSPLAEAFSVALAPPEPLTVSQWADKKRILPEISTHEAGLWRTSRFPFVRRIQDLLSPQDPTQMIVVMKGAQLAFTEIFLNWCFYTIDIHPSPMLYVQKTLDACEVFLKQRFEPSISEMPELKDKIGRGKVGRRTGDTARIKVFPGGMIRFGGANSAASLRSMPIERLCLDEEDSYDSDIQHEGSPSELAIRRTANFPHRKIYRLSTPTVKETSTIEPLFEQGTKERYYVPCPHCGNMDWIKWKNIKWENDDPETVMLVCEECGSFIEERFKTQMLARGRWIAEEPDAKYPSFHISSLYSPYGFYSWADAVSLYLKAIRNKDNALLKTFVNTVLGETWSETGNTVKASWLEARKEDYSEDALPRDVVIISCGADVQQDRIECEVVGWGKGMESWSIDYRVFLGDTEQNAVWSQFDAYIGKQYTHATGVKMPITVVGVDAGYRTKIVYEFCRVREHRYIYPVMGYDGWGKGYIDRPMQRNKYGVWPFRAFVDEIKSKFYSYLQISDPGPGYCHFPNKPIYDKKLFKMYVSEYLDKVWSQGKYKLRWILPQGRRNEALDCRCLSIAALTIIVPDFDNLPINQPIVLQQKPMPQRRRKMGKGIH